MPQQGEKFGAAFMKAFRSGDEKAFEQLFRMYYAPLTFYANSILKDRIVSEDIVQDIFENLWNRRKQLKHIESLKDYLFKSVHNNCCNYLARKKEFSELIELKDEEIEKRVITIEIMAQIEIVMQSLPLRMQQVLKMHYLEEKSLLDISHELGIDPETARSHRYRAIQLLRKTISST